MRDSPADEALGRWLRGRTIPANRAYVRSFLANQGLNERDTRGILAVSRGLSLQDVHWIAEDGFPGRWAGVNLYENPFSRVLAWLAFTGYGSYVRTSVRSSPEFTANGALVCRAETACPGKRFLLPFPLPRGAPPRPLLPKGPATQHPSTHN